MREGRDGALRRPPADLEEAAGAGTRTPQRGVPTKLGLERPNRQSSIRVDFEPARDGNNDYRVSAFNSI